ncbi:MAG TPA: S-methyl-5-thioribose-1-phosphate isomerase [Ktedonobacterales bacterium]
MGAELRDGVYSAADGVPLTLWWDADIAPGGALRLVDQSLLPATYAVVTCATLECVADAIRTLRVRGAPAIGVAAAYGLALGARATLAEPLGAPAALAGLGVAAATLRATRPTAVNLAWALDRLQRRAQSHLQAGGASETLPAALLAEAHAVASEDAAACRAMGTLGAELIADGDVLLTHCNAGSLATAGMGTALAPIFTAHRQGKRLRVFVDETRPVLQGARLTAWELARAGVPHTLITDSMAAHFMRAGGIRGVFVGADRIAANGDVANKIGTYGLAVLAAAHGIPLYVVAPRSTIDLALADGGAIPIEQRAPDEVRQFGGVLVAPAESPVANPAFDVTPGRLVAAIITEAGIARAPYDASLAALCQ